jgi:OOP family OmpA-OmpF porin
MQINKLLAAVALTAVAAASHADNFFVNTNLGVSNYALQSGALDRSGYAQALRFGYQWGGDFSYGIETGYANLGHGRTYYPHITGTTTTVERVDGFMLGGNLKYALPQGFYVSGRAGFFRSRDNIHVIDRVWRLPDTSNSVYRDSHDKVTGMSSYVGLGVGYDLNKSFGLGLSYDRYRAHQDRYSELTPRVGMYSVTAEYRF